MKKLSILMDWIGIRNESDKDKSSLLLNMFCPNLRKHVLFTEGVTKYVRLVFKTITLALSK